MNRRPTGTAATKAKAKTSGFDISTSLTSGTEGVNNDKGIEKTSQSKTVGVVSEKKRKSGTVRSTAQSEQVGCDLGKLKSSEKSHSQRLDERGSDKHIISPGASKVRLEECSVKIQSERLGKCNPGKQSPSLNASKVRQDSSVKSQTERSRKSDPWTPSSCSQRSVKVKLETSVKGKGTLNERDKGVPDRSVDISNPTQKTSRLSTANGGAPRRRLLPEIPKQPSRTIKRLAGAKKVNVKDLALEKGETVRDQGIERKKILPGEKVLQGRDYKGCSGENARDVSAKQTVKKVKEVVLGKEQTFPNDGSKSKKIGEVLKDKKLQDSKNKGRLVKKDIEGVAKERDDLQTGALSETKTNTKASEHIKDQALPRSISKSSSKKTGEGLARQNNLLQGEKSAIDKIKTETSSINGSADQKKERSGVLVKTNDFGQRLSVHGNRSPAKTGKQVENKQNAESWKSNLIREHSSTKVIVEKDTKSSRDVHRLKSEFRKKLLGTADKATINRSLLERSRESKLRSKSKCDSLELRKIEPPLPGTRVSKDEQENNTGNSTSDELVLAGSAGLAAKHDILRYTGGGPEDLNDNRTSPALLKSVEFVEGSCDTSLSTKSDLCERRALFDFNEEVKPETELPDECVRLGSSIVGDGSVDEQVLHEELARCDKTSVISGLPRGAICLEAFSDERKTTETGLAGTALFNHSGKEDTQFAKERSSVFSSPKTLLNEDTKDFRSTEAFGSTSESLDGRKPDLNAKNKDNSAHQQKISKSKSASKEEVVFRNTDFSGNTSTPLDGKKQDPSIFGKKENLVHSQDFQLLQGFESVLPTNGVSKESEEEIVVGASDLISSGAKHSFSQASELPASFRKSGAGNAKGSNLTINGDVNEPHPQAVDNHPAAESKIATKTSEGTLEKLDPQAVSVTESRKESTSWSPNRKFERASLVAAQRKAISSRVTLNGKSEVTLVKKDLAVASNNTVEIYPVSKNTEEYFPAKEKGDGTTLLETDTVTLSNTEVLSAESALPKLSNRKNRLPVSKSEVYVENCSLLTEKTKPASVYSEEESSHSCGDKTISEREPDQIASRSRSSCAGSPVKNAFVSSLKKSTQKEVSVDDHSIPKVRQNSASRFSNLQEIPRDNEVVEVASKSRKSVNRFGQVQRTPESKVNGISNLGQTSTCNLSDAQEISRDDRSIVDEVTSKSRKGLNHFGQVWQTPDKFSCSQAWETSKMETEDQIIPDVIESELNDKVDSEPLPSIKDRIKGFQSKSLDETSTPISPPLRFADSSARNANPVTQKQVLEDNRKVSNEGNYESVHGNNNDLGDNNESSDLGRVGDRIKTFMSGHSEEPRSPKSVILKKKLAEINEARTDPEMEEEPIFEEKTERRLSVIEIVGQFETHEGSPQRSPRRSNSQSDTSRRASVQEVIGLVEEEGDVMPEPGLACRVRRRFESGESTSSGERSPMPRRSQSFDSADIEPCKVTEILNKFKQNEQGGRKKGTKVVRRTSFKKRDEEWRQKLEHERREREAERLEEEATRRAEAEAEALEEAKIGSACFKEREQEWKEKLEPKVDTVVKREQRGSNLKRSESLRKREEEWRQNMERVRREKEAEKASEEPDKTRRPVIRSSSIRKREEEWREKLERERLEREAEKGEAQEEGLDIEMSATVRERELEWNVRLEKGLDASSDVRDEDRPKVDRSKTVEQWEKQWKETFRDKGPELEASESKKEEGSPSKILRSPICQRKDEEWLQRLEQERADKDVAGLSQQRCERASNVIKGKKSGKKNLLRKEPATGSLKKADTEKLKPEVDQDLGTVEDEEMEEQSGEVGNEMLVGDNAKDRFELSEETDKVVDKVESPVASTEHEVGDAVEESPDSEAIHVVPETIKKIESSPVIEEVEGDEFGKGAKDKLVENIDTDGLEQIENHSIQRTELEIVGQIEKVESFEPQTVEPEELEEVRTSAGLQRARGGDAITDLECIKVEKDGNTESNVEADNEEEGTKTERVAVGDGEDKDLKEETVCFEVESAEKDGNTEQNDDADSEEGDTKNERVSLGDGEDQKEETVCFEVGVATKEFFPVASTDTVAERMMIGMKEVAVVDIVGEFEILGDEEEEHSPSSGVFDVQGVTTECSESDVDIEKTMVVDDEISAELKDFSLMTADFEESLEDSSGVTLDGVEGESSTDLDPADLGKLKDLEFDMESGVDLRPETEGARSIEDGWEFVEHEEDSEKSKCTTEEVIESKPIEFVEKLSGSEDEFDDCEILMRSDRRVSFHEDFGRQELESQKPQISLMGDFEGFNFIDDEDTQSDEDFESSDFVLLDGRPRSHSEGSAADLRNKAKSEYRSILSSIQKIESPVGEKKTPWITSDPVTTEEVEKAAKISPLACTLIKVPDAEILSGMPVNAQRDLVALHAEAILGPAQQAKAKSSAENIEKKKDVPDTSPDQSVADDHRSPKPQSKDQAKVRSILKREGSFERSRVSVNVRKRPDQEISSSDEEHLRKGLPPLTSTPLVVPKVVDRTSSSDETTPNVRCSNEAIARRRARKEQERFNTQPVTGSPETTERRRPKAFTARHLTQPITVGEKKVAEKELEEEDMSKMSIQERLALLKQRGEEDWKKRVSKTDETLSLSPEVKRREKRGRKERPKSINDLVSQLETSAESWRGRVEEKDMRQFTVEGKLSAQGKKLVPESPLLARKKKAPKAEAVHLKNGSESSESTSTSTPPTSPSKPSLPKMTLNDQPMTNPTANDEDNDLSPKTVEIPKFDDTENFFSSQPRTSPERTQEIDDDAFNDVFVYSQDILQSKKRIKPRRTRPTSRNPLRVLQERKDIKNTYEEGAKTNIAAKEMERMKKERVVGNQGFAESALAGLASKENFCKVALKKVTDTATPSKTQEGLRVEPYKDVMLLQVKGRRQIQFRLVEPKAESLNSGDCFILVTSEKVFCWMGEFCNVIEKAKAQEIATTIFQKKDLGFKGTRNVIMLDESRGQAHDQFWSTLGGVADYQDVGPDDEDLLYETFLTETNMVYCLEGNSLIPVEEYWGKVLKHDMLNSTEIYVFDFGTEMYVWHGKKVSFEKRKIAMRLAKQLWDQGYDYSELEISPLSPFKAEDEGGLPLKSDIRPSWCLLAKINENMETILFKEKFKDWPDTNRVIRVKGGDSEQSKTEVVVDLKPFDAKQMIPLKKDPVTLVLEGSHVGRGRKWVESFEGLKKEFDIVTIKVMVWHVMEYDHYQIHQDSYGQFHSGDTYVIRWQYMIMAGGLKNLKGHAARQSLTGRERCAYFFWQGSDSTINEKGASALMTVELDEERGPQIRVIHGREPPCFLNLFDGNMIIHIGKREEEATNTQGDWRLYAVRNELESESYLMEVVCCIANLRSRSSFILLNVRTGALFIWNGAKSSEEIRSVALKIAQRLMKKCPLEVGLREGAVITATEVEEGKERRDFWAAMDDLDRDKYECLVREPRDMTHTPRLFYMNSVSGVFEVFEQLNPSRSELCTPFPFLQADLHKASQPALFLFDDDREVYLWQGWWPEGDEESENVNTGSARARLDQDRRCAMETTLQYCLEKNCSSPPPAYLVYAGLEPKHFTNLFPTWEVNEEASEANIKDGRKEGLYRVKDVLTMISRTEYTFAELQERPLPDGVDPSKIESYLCEEEFQEVLGMPKTDYYALPSWKQIELKKMADLF